MRRIIHDPTSTKITGKDINEESFMKRLIYIAGSISLIGLLMYPILSTSGVTGTAAPGSGANVTSAGEIVAKQNNCLACHSVNNKLVGPAFKDVANKYTEANREFLVNKIIKGGGGVWGPIPMPPNAVDEQQANQAVTWILGLR